MDFKNSTPFVPFQFESVDKQLTHFGVVLLRGTFDIENGERLALSAEQESPILTDEFFEVDGKAALRFEKQPCSVQTEDGRTD